MRPFNLEEAIKHPDRVRYVCDDGSVANSVFIAFARLGDKIVARTKDAHTLATMLSEAQATQNLSMADPVREYWCNTYIESKSTAHMHQSKEAAITGGQTGNGNGRSFQLQPFLYHITDDGENLTIERVKL